MVMTLYGYCALTGKVSTCINVQSLVDLEMKHNEPIETFIACIRDTVSNLLEGRLDLDPMLIIMFVMNGPSNKFQSIRKNFYIHNKEHGQLSVDEIQKPVHCLQDGVGDKGQRGQHA